MVSISKGNTFFCLFWFWCHSIKHLTGRHSTSSKLILKQWTLVRHKQLGWGQIRWVPNGGRDFKKGAFQTVSLHEQNFCRAENRPWSGLWWKEQGLCSTREFTYIAALSQVCKCLGKGGQVGADAGLASEWAGHRVVDFDSVVQLSVGLVQNPASLLSWGSSRAMFWWLRGNLWG